MRKVCIFRFLQSLLCGCAATKYISVFSKNQVEWEVTQQEFINKYGKPHYCYIRTFRDTIDYSDECPREHVTNPGRPFVRIPLCRDIKKELTFSS